MADEICAHKGEIQQNCRDLSEAQNAPTQLSDQAKLPWSKAKQLQRFLIHATIRHWFNCYLANVLSLYLSKRHSPLYHRCHSLCNILVELHLRA